MPKEIIPYITCYLSNTINLIIHAKVDYLRKQKIFFGENRNNITFVSLNGGHSSAG